MGSIFYGQEDVLLRAYQNDQPNMSSNEDADVSVSLSKPLSGQLSKYTNVVKGWQNRYFVLNPSSCTLEYYEREELKNQKPRGVLSLHLATIAPSEEDSVTFAIHLANGEICRLRAESTKIRQLWVSRLMYSAQGSRSRSNTESTQTGKTATSHEVIPQTSFAKHFDENPALTEVKEYLSEVSYLQESLVEHIDSLPSHGSDINSLDETMLLLKACSKATLSSLEQCLYMLEKQHASRAAVSAQRSVLPSGAKVEWLSMVKNKLEVTKSNGSDSSFNEFSKAITDELQMGFTQPFHVPPVNREEEVEDVSICSESDLGEMEQHKSVILHLLSQLKLGMDLTKVVLPTFILEKRSLLEMFADCMAHPDTFIKVSDCTSPEARMMQVVEWYLTSFHAGRMGSIAKKPYNPIIGETFHCSWHVSEPKQPSVTTHVIYTAEQVSHHPPVSAFHVTCPQKQITLTGSFWTKSKFMGMSIGVSMVGQLMLHLSEFNEEYVMTSPSAYARSILSQPWVELGDRCRISCKQTGYQASIIFHTKPFYGGKLHKISGEVKNAEGTVFCKIAGSWNGEIEFTNASTSAITVIDTQKMLIHKKHVRPISKQGEYESRRLWQHVTKALLHGDITTATDHKKLLENKQREDEKHRKEKGIQYPTKYFQRVGEISNWIYKVPVHNKQ